MLRRFAPLWFLALVAAPSTPLGAADLPAVVYDAEAAVHDELAERMAALDTPEARASTLGWIDAQLAVDSGVEARRALIEARCAVLAADSPLPEGFRGEFIGSVAAGATLGDVLQGVPASVSIAQAILESGWGRSAPGHNLFGMTGVGPAGSIVRKSVDYRRGKRILRRTPFRLYHDVAGSLMDHAQVLSTSARYAEARAVADDPALYARALQGKYASDPRYAGKLDELRERYGLDRFNWAPPPAVEVADGAPATD